MYLDSLTLKDYQDLYVYTINSIVTCWSSWSSTSYLLDGVDSSLNPLHFNPFPSLPGLFLTIVLLVLLTICFCYLLLSYVYRELLKLALINQNHSSFELLVLQSTTSVMIGEGYGNAKRSCATRRRSQRKSRPQKTNEKWIEVAKRGK